MTGGTTRNSGSPALAWARRLALEHEEIRRGRGVALSTPAFEIIAAGRTCGFWDPLSGTIAISGRLILHHPWPVTLNVLKHEMAHQLCSEVWGSRQTAHGPDFHRACDILGVPPEFRYATASLPREAALYPGGAPRHGVAAKVEKLLALAGSDNEHEAALAMSKANELLARHNLAPSAARRHRYADIHRKRKRIEAWQRSICRILRDFFYVKTVVADQYDPLADDVFKVIEIFGLAENVEVAEYCYYFLEERLETLWRANRHRFRGGLREKNSFTLGVLSGVYEKLRDEERRRTKASRRPGATGGETTSALALAGDPGLDEFIALRHPRLRTVKRRGAAIHRDTYEHGRGEGRKISLRKGVTTRKGGRLLPHRGGSGMDPATAHPAR